MSIGEFCNREHELAKVAPRGQEREAKIRMYSQGFYPSCVLRHVDVRNKEKCEAKKTFILYKQ